MASYIRSWWTGSTISTAEADPPAPAKEPIPSINIQEDDGSDTEREDYGKDDYDDDVAPAFPALNSAQRARSSRTTPASSSTLASPSIPRILTDSDLMPPPPIPQLANRIPGVPPQPNVSRNSLPTGSRLSASSDSSLAPPPTTTKAPVKPSKRRVKVELAPGFGPLDWATLKSSGADLRGVDQLMRVTPSVLKQHNKRDDAWSAINGKVYNITHYLPYHPGGEKELLRVAGRDGTKLFATTHAWVNADFMLDSCLVGFLVSES